MAEPNATDLRSASPDGGSDRGSLQGVDAQTHFLARARARFSLLLENLNFSRRLEMTYLKRQMRRYLASAHPACGLDIACGLGNLTETVAETAKTRILGIDCNRDSIGVARAHLRSGDLDFLPADSHNLPFREGSFDFATSICAFEHFEDDRTALAEVSRVLKPGAYFFLTVDSLSHPGVDDDFRQRHTRECFVHQYYSDADIRAKLEDADFEVIHSTYLLRSRTASLLTHYGLKSEFGKSYMILSALLYGFVLVGESFSRGDYGYKLGITARRASRSPRADQRASYRPLAARASA